MLGYPPRHCPIPAQFPHEIMIYLLRITPFRPQCSAPVGAIANVGDGAMGSGEISSFEVLRVVDESVETGVSDVVLASVVVPVLIGAIGSGASNLVGIAVTKVGAGAAAPRNATCRGASAVDTSPDFITPEPTSNLL